MERRGGEEKKGDEREKWRGEGEREYTEMRDNRQKTREGRVRRKIWR